jgi:hypothetical protein
MVRSNFKRQAADYYPTPAWCTEALLKVWQPRGTQVWEPGVGSGNIANVLEAAGYTVIGSDLYEPGAYPEEVGRWPDTIVEDFFEAPARCPAIITNPPYSCAAKFLRRAISLTAHSGQVAMLMRNEFDSAATRQDLFGANTPFAGKVVLTKRPYWSEDRIASPRHNFSWFVWDHNHFGDPWLRYAQ